MVSLHTIGIQINQNSGFEAELKTSIGYTQIETQWHSSKLLCEMQERSNRILYNIVIVVWISGYDGIAGSRQ